MVLRQVTILIIIILLSSCKKEDTISKEVLNMPINIKIERFDSIFAISKPIDLPKLKKDYPFLFSKRYPDSLWIHKMTDTLEQQLYEETLSAFSEFNDTKQELELFYKHLKYYFPESGTPRILTVVSDVDYRNKAIVTDSIVLIALDTYLGKDHKFYGNIPEYLRQNLDRKQLVSDLAAEYAKPYIYPIQNRTLLDEMIFFGKILYFKDVMLPLSPDTEKIGYTSDELEWAEANESEIWRYFVEKELLYSTDSQLTDRFINPAPFSKFYLELDSESPGRLGQYIGWQIVRSYMENNKVDLKKMLISNSEVIFNKSKYKPRK